MKKVQTITILAVTALLLTTVMTAVPAMAATYQINQLYNWGVTLDDSATKVIDGITYNTLDNSDWIPGSPTADYVIEDNMDAQWSGDSQFNPAGYTGYHKNSQDAAWKEPKIKAKNGNWYIQPSGSYYTAASREENDLEAFYFDSDGNNAYFAIVVSIPPDIMGDLALSLDGDPAFEYGIVLQSRTGFTQGDVCSGNLVWSKPSDFPDEGPYRITSAANINAGAATVSIVDSGVNDYGRTNHVIEIKVPRSALGNPSFSNLYATISCGNDEVELMNVEWEIPEFSTIAIPVAMILGLFYFFRRKRER